MMLISAIYWDCILAFQAQAADTAYERLDHQACLQSVNVTAIHKLRQA